MGIDALCIHSCGVMLAGVILGWFDKKEEPPAEEEQTEQAAVTDGEGNAMDTDMVYPMPAKMSFNAQTFAQFWRAECRHFGAKRRRAHSGVCHSR